MRGTAGPRRALLLNCIASTDDQSSVLVLLLDDIMADRFHFSFSFCKLTPLFK